MHDFFANIPIYHFFISRTLDSVYIPVYLYSFSIKNVTTSSNDLLMSLLSSAILPPSTSCFAVGSIGILNPSGVLVFIVINSLSDTSTVVSRIGNINSSSLAPEFGNLFLGTPQVVYNSCETN